MKSIKIQEIHKNYSTHENLYLSHVPPQGPLPKIKNQ